jgi:hypothetical protein
MFTVLGIVVALLVAPVVLRPCFTRWGATDAESAMELPGDGIAKQSSGGFTHAITIDAPPERVWPWVIQIGYQRAGWYTYDWFYALTKSGDFVDGRSSDRIVPELQALKVGDVIKMQPSAPFKVVTLEPARAMVLQADGAPVSWVWHLEPTDGGGTRLIERFRMGTPPSFGGTLASVYILDPGSFVFSRKHLLGVKERAEAGGRR